MTRGGVIVHVALVLALLAGYGTMMMLIGVADHRGSGIAIGASDALMAVAVGLLPAVPGVIAFVRLPRGDALRIEALLAIAISQSLSGVLLLAMFVG